MHNSKISWIYLHAIELEKKNEKDSYLAEEHPLHAERWQTSFINWIVINDISFEAATDPTLHEIILHGGPSVRDLLPSRNTVRTWLMTTYKERLNDVQQSINNSRSKVVLSLDSWSAPNKLSLLEVVGHWLDKERNLKTALLVLRPLDGHAGTDIADVLRSVMATFSLTTAKVSAYQMDNATNNDTALKELDSAVAPQTRLRCLGHIIDLVRQQGAIGHLHNLVTYITRNDRRLREFEASQKVEISDLKQGAPTLEAITEILKIGKNSATLRSSYNTSRRPQSVSKAMLTQERTEPYGGVIPTMDYLFSKLKKHATEVEESPEIFTDHYTNCLNHGFAKLSKYYTRIDESLFYAAAVALHPCKRFTSFDEIWSKTTGDATNIHNARQSTRRLCDDYLRRAIAKRELSPPKQASLFVQDEDAEDDEN
ncbi:hypothetical protein Q7P35_005498 [Cladosporium inversicolor]